MKTFIISLVILCGLAAVIVWGKRDVPESIAPAQTESVASPEATPQEASTPAVSKTPKGTTTKNGMKIETLKEGNGPEIKNGQTAVVQYEGKLTDGSIFDSTAKRNNTPFEFPLGAGMVIKGWDEGVLGMKVGETRLLTIPPELGYGPNGYPPIIPQNATLIFTVTLEGIK